MNTVETCIWCGEGWTPASMVELPDGLVCTPCYELIDMANADMEDDELEDWRL